jgi:hypothetical protein
MPVTVIATLQQALRQLEAERTRIDRQISAVRAALDGAGRPEAASAAATPGRRRRRRVSAAARKAASQRMKAYWAKRRAGQSADGKSRK